MFFARGYGVVLWVVVAALAAVGCARPLPDVGDNSSGGSSHGGPSYDSSSSSGEADTYATVGPMDTASDETGIEPSCGNGIVEAGEDCEDDDLADGTCEGLGFEVGTLSCGGDCSFDTSECRVLPDAPVLELSFSQVKQFDFAWAAAAGAEYYQLLESPSQGDGFVQLRGNIVGESISIEMPLHFRHEASYELRACNGGECSPNSDPVSVVGSLAEAVGYFKASNTGSADGFGYSVALSGDGNTLAVGAFEDSSATGIGGEQANGDAPSSGAVYVFVRDGMGTWSQQAYIKASNTGSGDWFGASVALSGDGNTLAVGACLEDSNATGIGGNQADNSFTDSGAVYVFVRDGMGTWSQQAYVKASNTGSGDEFGYSVTLSGDGNTLAVGADHEDSIATGTGGGGQASNAGPNSGAVYVFGRDGMSGWSQQVYVKASNTGSDNQFGYSVALSEDGITLAVGAQHEESNATGIDGDQANNNANFSGAVYVFVRDGVGMWSQQAYVKASNTGSDDRFGWSVTLSEDGNTLAIGAILEGSNATGIGGDQANNAASYSGAVYVFDRDGMGVWSQQAYVKASNTGYNDWFGGTVALNGNGNALAVGAYYEGSNATGIGGDQTNNTAGESGAVYVFVRDGAGSWSQHAYIKASNTGYNDQFGYSVALSGDGNTLAVGASYEGSNATGIGGDQANDAAAFSGAVYLY